MKIFIYPKKDEDGIAVATIADPDLDPFKVISEDGFYITNDDIPEMANDFFAAVEINDKKLSINLDKAREITKQRIRMERIKPLEQLDILFQRALEGNKDLTQIEEEKQRLRDITNEIDQITSLKELKDFSVSSNLKYDDLRGVPYSDIPHILALQKENEQLQLNVNKMELEIDKILKALKKKYII